MAPRFSTLIRKKEGILGELLPLSIHQLQLVRRGDITSLLNLLGQKQAVFERFEQIEKELGPFRDIEPGDRQWKNEEERVATAKAIKHCEAMLREIMEHDTQSTEELGVQKKDLEGQIRQVQYGIQVNKGYAKQSAQSGNVRRFDVSK